MDVTGLNSRLLSLEGQLPAKLDNTGGTLTGSLTITGSLIVGGLLVGGIGGAQSAWKTATTSRNTTGLADDPDLTLSLAGSAVYEIRCVVVYTSASGGVAIGFTSPSGASGGYGLSFFTGGSTPTATTWTAGGLGPLGSGGGTYAAFMAGILITSSSGTFAFRWAPNSVSTTVVVGVGSYLIANRIG